MARWQDYLVDVAKLAAPEPSRVLALVDLARCAAGAPVPPLPPCPVIGIGDAAHPVARECDAVVAAPASLATIIAQVTRHPLAAAALVQLLRGIDGLADDRALALESQGYAMLQGSAEHKRWRAARRPPPAAPPPGRVCLRRDGATVEIVIDRAAAHNAIDRPIRDALFEAFTIASLDAEVRRVRLRAAGRAFGVGAALDEFGTTPDPATAHAIRALTLPALPLSRCAAIVDVHLQGACVGASLEVAAFAARVTASPRAWFQLPELAMGLIPGAGGCVSVPRRIGRQRAALMILSGRRVDAATALRWGLIDAIVDEPPVDPGGADPD